MAVSVEWHCVDTEYKTEYEPPEGVIKIVDVNQEINPSTFATDDFTVTIDYTRSL